MLSCSDVKGSPSDGKVLRWPTRLCWLAVLLCPPLCIQQHVHPNLLPNLPRVEMEGCRTENKKPNHPAH